jgi:hypothetical protein
MNYVLINISPDEAPSKKTSTIFFLGLLREYNDAIGIVVYPITSSYSISSSNTAILMSSVFPLITI